MNTPITDEKKAWAVGLGLHYVVQDGVLIYHANGNARGATLAELESYAALETKEAEVATLRTALEGVTSAAEAEIARSESTAMDTSEDQWIDFRSKTAAARRALTS